MLARVLGNEVEELVFHGTKGSDLVGDVVGDDCADMCGVSASANEDVAMTRKVVRSKSTTSVALQASPSFARCRVRTEAFGMSVCTMRDQAYKTTNLLNKVSYH